MTTSNKNFKIKNGLEVLGTSATVNGNAILSTASVLSDLANVDTSGITDGQTIIYDQATLTFIPGNASGGDASITVSETAPPSPEPNSLWYNSSNGGLFIYLVDVDPEQWVQVGEQGPQGLQGEQGLEGPPGPQGDTGAQGLQGLPGLNGLDGLSAYEVAVNNGFLGTEQEWLDYLVGPEGPQGLEGPQGPEGEAGEAGIAGIAGAGYAYVLPEPFGGPGVAYEPVGNSTISLSSGDFGAYAVGNYVRYYPNPEADPTAWVEGEITSKTGDESLTITVDNWSETAPGISGAGGTDETRPYMTLASKTGSGYSYTWPFGTHPGSGGFWNPPIAGESIYEVPGPLGAYQVGNYVRFYLNPASYPDAWFEGTITGIEDFSDGIYTTVPGTQYATITIEDWDPSAENLSGVFVNIYASTPEEVEANELLIANPPYMTISAKNGVDGAGYNYEPIPGASYSVDLSTVPPGTPGLATILTLGSGKIGAYKVGDFVKWTSNDDSQTYLYGTISSLQTDPHEAVIVEVTQVNLGSITTVTSARLSIAGLPGADGADGALNAVAKVNGTVTTASTSLGVVRNTYVSTSNPSGGMDGDVWMVYS